MTLTQEKLKEACNEYVKRVKPIDEYEVKQAFISGMEWVILEQLREGNNHGK